ncbi:MAG: metallophosphoesterase family protein [Thermoanaerobaculia bacterium]
MRYLIVSDMHGNWEAFAAVLEDVHLESFDAALVLGDLVGYGASPNQVVEAVRTLPLPTYVIRGNHDKVAARVEEGEYFNAAALEAARWTTAALKAENLRYVRELPPGPLEIEQGLVICHGSPLDEDAYVLSSDEAEAIFHEHRSPVTFFGHTHIPSLFVLREGEIEISVLAGDRVTMELEPDARYLINPGSVGQPRDRDWRAAYMSYDSTQRVVELFRIEYPLQSAQQRIVRADLPTILAQRLSLGV